MARPTSKRIQPVAGSLLVSEPMMEDPNFRRTIVLLCEHNDEGSFGLILNETLPHQLSEVLEYEGAFDAQLRLGGPCEHNTLHVLHAYPEISGSERLMEGLFWGGNFVQIQEMIEFGRLDPNKIAFFLGYSGWSAGQLVGELRRKDWFVTQAEAAWVFQGAGTQVWRSVLRHMGGEFCLLANFPDDPRLN